MAPDCVVLTSDGHADSLLNHLAKLQERDLLTDLLIILDGGVTYKVHKVVMATFSCYFKSQLDAGLLEGGQHTLNNIDANMFGPLLAYFYTGHLKISSSSVLPLLTAATYLDMPDALALCQHYLGLGSEHTTETADIHVKQEPSELDPAGVPKTIPIHTKKKEDSEHRNAHIPFEGKHTRKRRKSKSPKQKRKSCNVPVHRVLPTVAPSELGSAKKKMKIVKKVDGDVGENVSHSLDDFDNDSDFNSWDCEELENHVSGEQSEVATEPKQPTGLKLKLQRQSNIQHSHSRSAQSRLTSVRRKVKMPKFECTICHKKFAFFSLLSLHRSRHKKLWYANLQDAGKRWVFYRCLQRAWRSSAMAASCEICHKSFSFYSKLTNHLKFAHFSWNCKRCHLRFFTRKACWRHELCKHQMAARLKSSPHFQCAICLRTFLYEINFLQHIQKVHNPTGTCLNCQKPYKNSRSLQKHLVICYSQLGLTTRASHSLWQCRSCQRKFKYRRPYEKHINQCSNQWNPLDLQDPEHLLQNTGSSKRRSLATARERKQPWSCDQEGCDRAYTSHKRLREHMEEQHPNVVYSCNECCYRTVTKRLLERHLSSGHCKNNERTCNLCGKTFAKRSCLRIHKYSKHRVGDNRIKVSQCPVDGCSYKCLYTSSLKIHMQRHNLDKRYPCDICGRKMKHEQTLVKHINKVHRGIRPFMCDVCGQAYGEESELRTHIARHNTIKQYHCSQCNYATHDKGNYQSHLYGMHRILLRTDQPVFSCNICDFTTDRKHRYEMHMKNHLGIRDITCHICGKTFVTRNSLANHMQRVHSGKTYGCQFCDYTTGNIQHYREHVRVMHTHRDVKPYKCAYCDFRCHTSGNCRKHCANRHKGLEIKWVRLCELYNSERVQEEGTKDSNVPLATSSIRHQAVFRRVASENQSSDQEAVEVYTQALSMASMVNTNMQPFTENLQVSHNPLGC